MRETNKTLLVTQIREFNVIHCQHIDTLIIEIIIFEHRTVRLYILFFHVLNATREPNRFLAPILSQLIDERLIVGRKWAKMAHNDVVKQSFEYNLVFC